MVLATDLDGTFAGGSDADRTALQQILGTRSDTLLIYVTGRSIAATRELMVDTSLPHPDLLIADVGTSVRDGPDLAPALALEEEIAAAWPGSDLIRDRLSGLTEIVEQGVRSPYRVSYTPVASAQLAAASLSPAELRERIGVDDDGAAIETEAFEALLAAVRSRLEGLAIDIVGSAGIYIDLLPRGVNKGATLRRALRRLARSDEEVLVAGDSMNDLALFELGISGVAVGNSEPELVERVAGYEWVHLATRDGAAGIIEALGHYGWIHDASHLEGTPGRQEV